MKTIIFSDTHLTHIFDEKRYKYLRDIISTADQVIINGDFWDYYQTTFNLFIDSKWNHLFPLLKRKNTIYLYGNHDDISLCNDKVKLFSTKQNRKTHLKVGDKKLIVTHGDIFAPGPDIFREEQPYLVEKGSQLFTSFEKVGRAMLGEYFAFGRVTNVKTKQYASRFLDDDEILVCGHSHNWEFAPEHNYINLGIIDFGVGQYLEIKDDKMEMKTDRY